MITQSAFAVNEVLVSDKNSVNNSCSVEAQTANCGNEKVGTGLLKCIHGYKKAHKKDFVISDNCKNAMKKLRSDRKSIKESKK